MTITLANPNAFATLSGVAFSDSLPSGLVVATPNGLSNGCGGTAFAVNVIATSAGTKNNTTSVVTSIQAGPGATASASLAVAASSIPTLSPWAFALLAILLAAVALRVLRIRRI